MANRLLVTCGCGGHMIAPGTKYTVQWKGRHWDLRCAFRVAIESTNHHKVTKKLLFFKRLVEEHVPCALCGKPVGRSYKVLGDNIYHTYCLHDISGQ